MHRDRERANILAILMWRNYHGAYCVQVDTANYSNQ